MQDDVLGWHVIGRQVMFVTMIVWCPAAAIPGFILVTYMLSIHPYAIICQVIHKFWQLFKRIAVCYNDQRLPPGCTQAWADKWARNLVIYNVARWAVEPTGKMSGS